MWCGWRKKLTTVIDQLAAKFLGKVNVGQLNIGENKKTKKKYGIKPIPAMLFFKDGKMIHKEVGYRPIEKLRRIIQANM